MELNQVSMKWNSRSEGFELEGYSAEYSAAGHKGLDIQQFCEEAMIGSVCKGARAECVILGNS